MFVFSTSFVFVFSKQTPGREVLWSLGSSQPPPGGREWQGCIESWAGGHPSIPPVMRSKPDKYNL